MFKLKKNKYHRLISAVIFAAYFSAVIANIFHYHPVDFSTSDKYAVEKNNERHSSFVYNELNNCTFHLNFLTLTSYFFSKYSSFVFDSTVENKLITLPVKPHLTESYYRVVLHRGPPSFS